MIERRARGEVSAMNRITTLRLLAQAERCLSDGKRRLNRERALLEKLERGGHETSYARALLHQMEEAQALCIYDRDRILAELDASSQHPAALVNRTTDHVARTSGHE
jgi:hypothetical protein